MHWLMFTIKDNALNAYLRPFTARAKGEAVRLFTNEINNNQGDMFKHADDYELHYCGTFDDTEGQFADHPARPELVVRGKDVKERG